ncbi:MAG: glycosyltransferase family 4 protein [Deltaproteobacteria bacterium]|nr:glycosyltransferase family 4 protein [Deltaproteobacteria bacterium]MBW2339743.1 glycosyltransferase family 4 protein [Deltaproteobacteria bacterium]
MKRFNIALLHYTCPPVVGGVEEIIRQHASLFKRYNHRVKVFAGDGGVFTDDYDIELNSLLNSCNPRILQIQKNLTKKSCELESCAEEIFTYLVLALEPFDVLIAHNVLTMPYNLPLTVAVHGLANNRNIRVVSWNHDSPYFYDPPRLDLKGEQWNILKDYNPKIYYVTISEERRSQFQDLYGTKKRIRFIPDGIDPTAFFNLSPNTINMIREKRLLEAELLMVQPCRLHPRKNIELSIQVVKALQEKGVHARLLLTGAYDPHEKDTTEYYCKLRKLSEQLHIQTDILIAAEHFSVSGKELTGDTIVMRDFYLIADVLFIPSLGEGFGIPLLEAGILKLPIVCSDISPFKEIGKENVQYFSLKDSPEQIADKILNFISDLKPHQMFRHTMRNYMWDNLYHHMLLPLLQKVIS